MERNNKTKKEEYNKEDVHYCKACLSLKIKIMDDFDYCDECGSTNINNSNIEHWKELYKLKYGKTYLKNK